jgi:hypothetical protein
MNSKSHHDVGVLVGLFLVASLAPTGSAQTRHTAMEPERSAPKKHAPLPDKALPPSGVERPKRVASSVAPEADATPKMATGAPEPGTAKLDPAAALRGDAPVKNRELPNPKPRSPATRAGDAPAGPVIDKDSPCQQRQGGGRCCVRGASSISEDRVSLLLSCMDKDGGAQPVPEPLKLEPPGVEQPVSPSGEQARWPIDVALIVEVAGQVPETLWPSIRDGTRRISSHIMSSAGNRLGVLGYNSDRSFRPALLLSSDPMEVASVVSGLGRSPMPPGPLVLHEAILFGIKNFELSGSAPPGMRQRLMVVVAHGTDNVEHPEPLYQQLAERLVRNKITLSLLSLQLKPRGYVEALAQRSGGQSFIVQTPEDVARAWQNILDNLKEQKALVFELPARPQAAPPQPTDKFQLVGDGARFALALAWPPSGPALPPGTPWWPPLALLVGALLLGGVLWRSGPSLFASAPATVAAELGQVSHGQGYSRLLAAYALPRPFGRWGRAWSQLKQTALFFRRDRSVACLVALQGVQKWKSYPVSKQPFTIGNTPRCDVTVRSGNPTEVLWILDRDQNGWYLRCQDPAAPVIVEKEEHNRTFGLSDGRVFKVGEQEFIFIEQPLKRGRRE